MKYIRTRDGKIFHYQPTEDYQIIDEMIYKQADTIAELCDEFVVFDKEQPNGKMIYYKGFETLKKEFIDFDRDKEKVVIFGAIWTDRGLIYVAEMNDDGELELL